MNFLIYENGSSYTIRDTLSCFDKMGIKYRLVSYYFGDNSMDDDYFCHYFRRYISEDDYDAVFSINFFPLVAKCCHEKGIKYISWSYDNPLGINGAELHMHYPCNYIFMFDRIQVGKYRDTGLTNVFHMPLAVNVSRLDNISINMDDVAKYSSDISFVGKLYPSQMSIIAACLNDYQKGYIDSIIRAQDLVYGYYFVDELLTDGFVEEINNNIKKINPDSSFVIKKDGLSFAIGTQITRNNRLLLLKLLSNHFNVKLYSNERNELLDRVTFMGTAEYENVMPKIFKLSKINLNINLRASQSGIPLRAMDILGAGGFLLSSYQPEIDEHFGNGDGVVLYESIEDAYDKVEYYLKHDEQRMRIAERGHQIARDEFSYEKQFSKILTVSGM